MSEAGEVLPLDPLGGGLFVRRDALVTAIGALWHDVGKFRQRAYWGEVKKHEAHGVEWLESLLTRVRFLTDGEKRTVLEVVGRHHEADPYERDIRLVQLADHLASGERVRRDEEERGDPSKEPLLSIFTRISLDGAGMGEGERRRWVYSTGRFAPGDAIFPKDSSAAHVDYRGLWNEFERSWLDLGEGSPVFHDPEAFILASVSQLRIHAWCVPSAVYRDEPDISLADHLQVTAALAYCLWDLDDALLDRLGSDPFRDEEVALLVGGDVAGIQRFLYTISSDGAAKALRGRSAFVGFLCDAVAEFVRTRIGIPSCNVLYSSGGHFFMLAPLSAGDKLVEVRSELDDVLLDFFGGDLMVAVDSVPVLGSDLKISPGRGTSPLGERWARLGERLRAAKEMPWREHAVREPERVFGPFGTGGVDECGVCHWEGGQPGGLRRRGIFRSLTGDEEGKCSLCASFEELADKVRAAEYLLVRRAEGSPRGQLEWHTVVRALGFELWPVDGKELGERYREGDVVLRLSAPDLRPVGVNGRTIPVTGFRFLPRATPVEPDGRIRDLDALGRASEGAQYFGTLRMDVDSLGRIFREGFGGRLSLSRMMTLSRMLTAFFEGDVDRMCREDQGERLYLLYSGGDDLLAVGSWDAVLGLAGTIRQTFADFTCRNPAITVSGGAGIHHVKYPVYRAARDAGDFLNRAKELRRPDGRAKDAFGIWGAVVDWDSFWWIRSWQGKIREWIKGAQVGRGFLFKMSRIARLNADLEAELRGRGRWGEKDMERAVRRSRWLWMLVYYMGRESAEVREELERLRTELVAQNRIPHLDLVARWVELSTREVEGR